MRNLEHGRYCKSSWEHIASQVTAAGAEQSCTWTGQCRRVACTSGLNTKVTHVSPSQTQQANLCAVIAPPKPAFLRVLKEDTQQACKSIIKKSLAWLLLEWFGALPLSFSHVLPSSCPRQLPHLAPSSDPDALPLTRGRPLSDTSQGSGLSAPDMGLSSAKTCRHTNSMSR